MSTSRWVHETYELTNQKHHSYKPRKCKICARAQRTHEYSLIGNQKSDVCKQTGVQKTREYEPMGARKSDAYKLKGAQKIDEYEIIGALNPCVQTKKMKNPCVKKQFICRSVEE